MRISATGNSPARLPANAGVTLVETLVTLVLVGLLISIVVLSAPGPERQTREAARALAARVMLAADESILANRTLGLRVGQDGYGFSVLQPTGWTPATDEAFRFRPWPQQVGARIEGAFEEDSKASAIPQVRFRPIGETTPAVVRLSGPGGEFVVRIEAGGTAHVDQAQ